MQQRQQAARSSDSRVAATGLLDPVEPLRSPVVRLLHALPDWERAVPAADRALATRALVAPVVTMPNGVFDPVRAAASRGAGGPAVVIDGLLLRNTALGSRVVTELVGEGDVVDTVDNIEPSMLSARTEHVVHRFATVALLDDRFQAAARRWPGLRDVVDAQLSRQRRRASAHLALLQLPRVEDRIVALLTLFADRWGRVTPEGVVVELDLTHELIGQIVGARRPTVTLALAAVAESGALVRLRDRRWLLASASAGSGDTLGRPTRAA